MNQSNKCTLFGHTMDLTLIKYDTNFGTHDTLCINCSELFSICRNSSIWSSIDDGYFRAAYESITEYLYDEPI